MKLKRYIVFISAAVMAPAARTTSQPLIPVKSYTAPGKSTELPTFTLDTDAFGVIHPIDNIVMETNCPIDTIQVEGGTFNN